MSNIVELEESLARNKDAIKCRCGGYAEEAETTEEEYRRYGCGRHGCCDAAFVCAICGTRYAGHREAPEMD